MLGVLALDDSGANAQSSTGRGEPPQVVASCGVEARYTGRQYPAADESNQEPPLPGYGVIDVHAAWRLKAGLELFTGIDNLFDRTYYTFGSFTQLKGLPPNFSLGNPRTYSPAPPRVYFASVRAKFLTLRTVPQA